MRKPPKQLERAPLAYENNAFVNSPDGRIMHKTLGTVLSNRGDAYVDQCKMK